LDYGIGKKITLPVEYRHGCDTNAPDVRIFHGAKDAK
jgi:hypothetical protein